MDYPLKLRSLPLTPYLLFSSIFIQICNKTFKYNIILIYKVMGASIYSRNKNTIYEWRANNHLKFNEYQRNLQRKYDSWKRISKIFRQILI
jgi:hypothetical protein